MTGRIVRFIIGDDDWEDREVGTGLPQGAVLSPILYAIYTNEVAKHRDTNIEILQFADDIALYCKGGMLIDQKEDMEEEINRIHLVLLCLGLEFEPRKTECVLFRDDAVDNDMEYTSNPTSYLLHKKRDFWG